MSAIAVDSNLPFHLRGNFAPVTEEVTATQLEVRGSIPPELNGLYLRNGPNPISGASPHWFLGDGMIHGVELRNGEALSYRNRYVQTRPLQEGDEAAPLVRPDGSVDLTSAKANTNIVCHAGRILALVESSFPTEMNRELETIGIYDFDGRLKSPMTAHPKMCAVTGEMHFFGYGFMPPYLTYHRVNPEGELVQSEVIDVKGPTMIHDFAITDQHVIFMDLPVVFDVEAAAAGTLPYKWSDDYGARLGVMPRGGSNADVRWFEIDPCYVFHPLNAYTQGEEVVLDVARYPELWRESATDFRTALLHRFRIDLAAGRVAEERRDDQGVEFLRVDPRREGLKHRYGYGVQVDEGREGPSFRALTKYDVEKGTSVTHDFGAGTTPGEGVFAPASADGGEDEGWVLTYAFDDRTQGSELVMLDATHFDKPPVASIALPQRVPFGFHGNWIPDPA